MNRLALLAAGVLCFAFAGSSPLVAPQGGADWTPTKLDPTMWSNNAERVFKTFKNVACGVTLNYKLLLPKSKGGEGTGYLLMNEYFWTPTKFRIEYMDRAMDKQDVPSSEMLASNGAGKKIRLGRLVTPAGTNYSAKQGLFDVATDEELVELWPKRFSQYVFSPFAGGNATLHRYMRALIKGVGGYKIQTDKREVTYYTKKLPQIRVLATRPAKGNRPESRVEMIFSASAPYLPVTIHATYGKLLDMNWSGQWYNNVDLSKRDPFRVDR